MRRRTRRRQRLGRAALLAGILAATPPSGIGAPGDRPGVFLIGATVPRAKALALDSALENGWHVAATGRGHAVLEIVLEEPAGHGPPDAIPPEQTLLRIRADFIQTPAGVNAYLYAEEIWYPGTGKEWITDITAAYRDNLAQALASLQARWKGIAREPPSVVDVPPNGAARLNATRLPAADGHAWSGPEISPDPEPNPDPGAPNEQTYASSGQLEVEVGTWAYDAEQLAARHGCDVADTGAELLGADQTGEVHRVPCRGGGAMVIRCDRERCGVGR